MEQSVDPGLNSDSSVHPGSGSRGWGRARLVRLGVAYCIALATLLGANGFVVTIRAFERMAHRNASLSDLDRVYGDWSGRPLTIRDRRVVEDALVLLPVHARYRVVVGRNWRPLRRTRWTNSLERDFLKYYLLPRRVSRSRSVPWVFCLACDRTKLGSDVRVLSEGFDGFLLVKVLH